MSGFKYIESNKVSKAQKRRDAKAAKKVEQIKRIEEAEQLDEHKDRRIEQENLAKLLSGKGLKIHDIDADGDCLYRAIEHQLGLSDDAEERLTYRDIRARTSQHMLENADNFLPFLLDERGELMDKRAYENYCNRIATTKEWGGHLELTAISQFTGKPIHVFQADQQKPITIEPQCATNKQPIFLSFHRHLYHLGEHYNSLVTT